MKTPLLSLAILGAELTTAVADSLPKINIESLCRARSADDKMMKLPESQSVADCIQDENTSKERLGTLWPAAAGSIRARCRADAVALGTLSYLDLLTCLQIADDIKGPSSNTQATRKSRNR